MKIQKMTSKLEVNSITLKLLMTMVTFAFHISAYALTEAELDRIVSMGGDIHKIAIKKEPGPNALYIEEVIHSKDIAIPSDEISFKWTELGYGINTHKVIVPSLAKHTLLNHRNDGEDGPCLKSDLTQFNGSTLGLDGKPMDIINSNQNRDSLPKEVLVQIKLKNNYIIDKSEGICKVLLIEDVRTVINGEEFYHELSKDMGFRFIDDCPQ